METRRLGRTGHESTVVTLGAFAFGVLDQDGADGLIEAALGRGVNQIDVAPSYADAEVRLGNYLKRNPLPDVFISCKTQQRTRARAMDELHQTMDRLGRNQLNLYQLHAVCNEADLDACSPQAARWKHWSTRGKRDSCETSASPGTDGKRLRPISLHWTGTRSEP